jgi:hypothetical protein
MLEISALHVLARQQCTSVSVLRRGLIGQKEQGAPRYRKMLAFR